MNVLHRPDRAVFPVRVRAAGQLTEAELLIEISGIVSSLSTFEEAIERIARLLERERSLSGLLVLEKRGARAVAIAHGGEYPPAGRLLSLPIREGNAEIGELRIAFRIGQSSHAPSLALAAFVAEQIGALLARRRLSEERADLKAGIDRLREELASVKLVSRAVGLLVYKSGLSERAARDWLELQSRKTGLAAREVAHRVVTRQLNKPTLDAHVPSGRDITQQRKTA